MIDFIVAFVPIVGVSLPKINLTMSKLVFCGNDGEFSHAIKIVGGEEPLPSQTDTVVVTTDSETTDQNNFIGWAREWNTPKKRQKLTLQ